MAHDNRDIAQESAEELLSKTLWEISDKYYEKHKWNEIYVVKTSKVAKEKSPFKINGIIEFKTLVNTHFAVFKVGSGVLEKIRHSIGAVGTMCMYVKRKPRELKSMWNLPFVKHGGLVIPDGRASSLVMDSISKLPKGINRPNPELYASLGKRA